MSIEDWTDFDAWWDQVGSGIRNLPAHDMEEHGKRIAEIAWFTKKGLSLPDGQFVCLVKDGRLVEYETVDNFFD
jgi:hypothetical protein